jgi:hypothetical protein
MNLSFLIFFFATSISTAQVDELVTIKLYERRRALERCLISNLQSLRGVTFAVPGDEVVQDDSCVNTPNFDVLFYVLSFLNPSELLTTRLVNRKYCKLSDYVNYYKICGYNPKFVLKENWMNYALSKFLFLYFEKGRIVTDDLFYAVNEVLFESSTQFESGKYPASLNFLSFIYEYEHGAGSSLPPFQSDLFLEIIAKLPEEDLPKAKSILEWGCRVLIAASNVNTEENLLSMSQNFTDETIEFIATKPDYEAIKAHFNFDPNLPLENSRLSLLPVFFRVAVLDLILPFCDNVERFHEAIELSAFSTVFPQNLLNQLNEKYPFLSDEVLNRSIEIYTAGQRALLQKYPRNDIVGLEYLLTRNTSNPFILQELLAMNPDIPQLMSAFLPCNSLTLTETDMISQMKEFGLFVGIQDGLRQKIESVISVEIRLEMNSNYFDFLISIIYNQV